VIRSWQHGETPYRGKRGEEKKRGEKIKERIVVKKRKKGK
jgi:hypothetical protein